MSGYQFGRTYYRIKYPPSDRPVYRREGDWADYPVIDCSEQGLRYLLPDPALSPQPGGPVRGTIRFLCGATVSVSGVIMRIQGNEVAIQLTLKPIPRDLLFQERIFLRNKHPNWM